MKSEPSDPWERDIRGVDVPISYGGEPSPLDTVDEFETGDAPLCPGKADIATHLHALFAPAFVHPHPHARIEIAYGHPETKGGAITEARNFTVFELKEATEFAEAKNRAGFNIYVGPALRQGKQPGDGRAKDKDVLASAYAWAEFDGAGDDKRIDVILKANQLAPAIIVTTGRVPHRRAHLYFRLDPNANAETVRAVNMSLMNLFGSDAVQNASRLMRLAGTINYPPPKKVERGYIAELVTLQFAANPCAYRADTLINLTAGTANPFLEYSKSVASGGRSDDELRALLQTSRDAGKWHNSMRHAIATMVGRGWSDNAIRFACAPYCEGGADDPDLVPLIDGAREKWNKHDDAASQPKLQANIPLDYYENFGKALAKPSIIKGVIAKGERSSWVGPPGSAKSTLLTDIAIHAADGLDWRGYRSKDRVGVVYFALERGQLVKRRLMAHAAQTMGPPNLPIAVASQVINLLNSECIAKIVETIRAAEAHYGCAVGLIIIDTYNKGIAAGGGDESSAKDQNITAANLQRVQDLTGVHIALVGHTGKDESRGARGSNAHMADVDMMVQISVDDDIRTATITKINDGAKDVLTRFELKILTLGQDEDGDDITTAIVSDDRLDTKKEMSRARLNKSQRRAMELLDRCIIEEGKPAPTTEYPTGVTVVEIWLWQIACLDGGLSPVGTKESGNKAFRRAVRDLLAMHRIGLWKDLVWIAYE